MNVLVSIILPVYNGSRFLRKSVDSVISQTYMNWELIIVDDCSTDNTPQIIKEYEGKDKRIRSIQHSKNLYLPQALNTGFESAKGDLFTWTSDDNLYLPNAIERMVKVLSDKSIDIVYGNEQSINENGQIIEGHEIFDVESIPICSAIGGHFMFRRNVFFEIGGYESKWFLVEDWQFWLKAYNKGFKFLKIEEYNYQYRKSSVSLTATKFIDQQAQALRLSLVNLKDNARRYSPMIAMRAYLKCIRWCFVLENKNQALSCFKQALHYSSDAEKYLNPQLMKWIKEA